MRSWVSDLSGRRDTWWDVGLLSILHTKNLVVWGSTLAHRCGQQLIRPCDNHQLLFWRLQSQLLAERNLHWRQNLSHWSITCQVVSNSHIIFWLQALHPTLTSTTGLEEEHFGSFNQWRALPVGEVANQRVHFDYFLICAFDAVFFTMAKYGHHTALWLSVVVCCCKGSYLLLNFLYNADIGKTTLVTTVVNPQMAQQWWQL